ncbi:glycosyltransferase [[Clostridium] innocuum]|nr:glycosyltransferase [[Clostridium] innocuum]
MKRALMTATVPSMIGQFNMNNIKLLQELGYKVDIATNFNDYTVWNQERINKFENELKELNIQTFNISFSRNPKDIKNLMNSYKQMKQLFDNQEYTLIHTHTPISSLITRLAYKRSNIYEACKMIYTAHGFHFFKGNNPIKNFIYRNIEKIGAKYTDVLITINKEDYEAAKMFKLKKNGTVEYVPGVGINIEKINSIQGSKKVLCNELDIPSESTLLLSVGELNDNKNHKVVIKSLPELPDNVHYIICGVGPLKEKHEQLANELKVFNRLHLLGYRTDVIRVMKSCDIFIFPSKREGLSVALMEAMACGLLCIASNIRGNSDLMNSYAYGYMFESNTNLSAKKIMEILKVKSTKNVDVSKYSKNTILSIMKKIYNNERNDGK